MSAIDHYVPLHLCAHSSFASEQMLHTTTEKLLGL